MENLTTFLESSSIHGLAYIATGRKYVRLFWILVVIAGFTGAIVLIYESFQSWADSPVKTTIETRAITDFTFPKVTVCPPKNTFTDLNYDLMTTGNMTIDNETRNELSKYATEILYDQLYDNIMANITKFEDNDRYYNWYHRYTKIKLPYYQDYTGLEYYLNTVATSGTISTQHFGKEFDADKVETDLSCSVFVYPLASVKNNPNVTLHFEVEKLSLTDLSSGKDTVWVGSVKMNVDTTHRIYNYTAPEYLNTMSMKRKVLPADVRKQQLSLMPGFRFTWHYSGMVLEPEAEYLDDSHAYVSVNDVKSAKAFIRNGSMNFL